MGSKSDTYLYLKSLKELVWSTEIIEVTIKCLRSHALKESPFVTSSDNYQLGADLKKWGNIANINVPEMWNH
jgi:hypothetical protein